MLSESWQAHAEELAKTCTVAEIARAVGESRHNIERHLLKYGIRARTIQERRHTLLSKMCETMTVREISEKLGKHKNNVREELKRLGLRAKRAEMKRKDVRKHEDVRKMYVEEKKTLRQIGKVLGITGERVRQILQVQGVESRKVNHHALEIGEKNRERVLELWEEGKTAKEICESMGIGQNAVLRHLKSLEVRPHRKVVSYCDDEEFSKKVLELRNQGKSHHDVGKALGVSWATSRRICLKYGDTNDARRRRT